MYNENKKDLNKDEYLSEENKDSETQSYQSYYGSNMFYINNIDSEVEVEEEFLNQGNNF